MRKSIKSTPQASTRIKSEEEKRKDDATIMMIHGLDILIAKATSLQMGRVARILYTAKEDLVYWAANLLFKEAPDENFINNHLYNNDMFAATDLIVRLSSIRNKRQRNERVKTLKTKGFHFELLEELQKELRG